MCSESFMNEDIKKQIAERLQKLRETLGLPQKDFAEKLGISQGFYANLEKSRYEIKSFYIYKLKQAFGVNPTWLLTGEGEMFLSDEQKKAEVDNDEFVHVPVVSGEISAGKGLYPDNRVDVRLAFRREWLSKYGDVRNMSLIRVRGDSMEPTLLDGDIVLVNHNHNYLSVEGGIYAICIGDYIMIKRLQVTVDRKIQVISDNPKYPPFTVDEDELVINGKVIWLARELKT